MQHLAPEQSSGGATVLARPVQRGPADAVGSSWWPTRSRQGFTAFALALTVLVGGSALIIVLAGTHLQHPVSNAFVRPYLAVAPLLIGLYWKLRRPDNAFGMLLILSGIAAWPLAWAASDGPALHTLGVLVGDTANTIMIFLLALAFPVGRLQSRADVVVMGLLVTALVARLTWAIGLPSLAGGGPLSRCLDACPTNPFQLIAPARLTEAATLVESVALLAATALVIAVVTLRLFHAPHPRRRALVTVALTSLLFFPLYLLYQLTRRVFGVEAPIVDGIGWLQITARMIFPLGFGLALLQADLFANGALRRLLDRLADRPSPEEWRDAVADSLDDPSLRLAFWDPDGRAYREPDGTELRPQAGAAAWVTVDRDDHPVAALSIDDVLVTDPELVEAAANATLLAVELGTLEGALRASLQATVDAGDSARRQMAQDLHDSAQQRLVALRMHLEMERSRARQPADREMLADLSRQVEEALGDIRAVVRGTRTHDLRRDGLAAAMESAAQSAGVPVDYRTAGVGRYSNAIEEAVYFAVLEALQNVAKHNAPGTSATLALSGSPRELSFAVEDDGRGMEAEPRSGAGLAGMRARLEAVGGTLTVESALGAGTRVTGVVPIAP